MSEQNNPFGNEPNTGHIWDDDLRELTNQPPKWWMWGMYASVALVVIYAIIYPMIPLVSTHTKGFTGWTSIGEYKQDLAAIEQVRAKYEEQLPGMNAAAILADQELSNYVTRSAKVLFGDNCAACHGSGGQGNPGFPVLADDDWLYGGTIEKIEESITKGRGPGTEGGGAIMTAHAAQLSEAEVEELTQAVAKGEPTSTPLFLEKGCIACHGMDGKGLAVMGAANLTDSIWRFGDGSLESIKYTILHGVNDAGNPQTRNAVMPKFGGTKLSETDIKKLAVYVHKLGGGQ